MKKDNGDFLYDFYEEIFYCKVTLDIVDIVDNMIKNENKS